MKEVQGIGLKKVLLGYGKAMHKRPKGDKKVNKKPAGLRLRKTVRGNTISDATVQINIKVLKQGGKKLSEMFSEQNKALETAPPAQEQAESVTESSAQKEVDKELAQPEQEPKQEKAEKPEEQKP